MVIAGHVGGTRVAGTVSSIADVLLMSVVRGISGLGGVCEMCMCGSGRRGGEWMGGLDFGFINPVCVLVAVVYVGSG